MLKKKRYYVSERIVNISEMEKLVQQENLLISRLRSELVGNDFSPLIVTDILNDLEKVNQKAIQFEFCLERRKTRI
ncbi:MAG: hypothetical protein Q4C58_07990 [Eubacteriales bacterium]|nr:hypothetical protein [Eubacteriales bacterium]